MMLLESSVGLYMGNLYSLTAVSSNAKKATLEESGDHQRAKSAEKISSS